MTNTLVSVQVDPDVDEFLSHFGVKGMHWGIRKARGVSVGTSGRVQSAPLARGPVTPASTQTRGQSRIASGQARLDRYDGSTKRAILHLAGAQIAEALLSRTAQMAVNRIPNPVIRTGADIALELGYTAVTVRNINEGLKVTEASSANKAKTRTRRR
jgi:hypothetical protein